MGLNAGEVVKGNFFIDGGRARKFEDRINRDIYAYVIAIDVFGVVDL